jgi:hypothetical protein
MGTLTRDQIAFEAGRSAVHARDASAREYREHVARLQASEAETRENQQILDGSRRESSQPAPANPDQPTKCRVLVPIMVSGVAAEVGAVVTLPLAEARGQAAINRVEIP